VFGSNKLNRSMLASLEEALADPDPFSVSQGDVDIALSEVVAPEEWKLGIAKMSEPRRRYLACHYLEIEVNNGGFNQFLLNKGPDSAREALAFLDERGQVIVAGLLRRAIDVLPGGMLPATYDELESILASDETSLAIDEAHRLIDAEFHNLKPDPQLTRERLWYVREHSEEFYK
jgi:hypothetical protein